MMYLIVTGNEYGYDLGNMAELNFVNEERGEELYAQYLEEYGCAAMFRVLPDKLELVKQEENF